MWIKEIEITEKMRQKAGEVKKAGTIIPRSAVTGFIALTLLGISAALNGCSPAGSPQATSSSTPQSSPALEETVRTNLNADPQLKASNLDVKANADRNEVTLSGKVESESVKSKAVESAKSAQAGLNVISNIDVDQTCCGPNGAHGPKEGMPGMKDMPGKEHRPQ